MPTVVLVDKQLAILCLHSRGQHLCKFIGTKESVYIRDGPLENLWGGGGRAKYKKNIRAREN